MAERPLLFEIYRLNIVDDDILTFDFMGQNIRTDEQILEVIEKVTSSDFSSTTVSGRTIYQWNVREFLLQNEDGETMCSINLGRSAIQQSGKTATADKFEEATTTFLPPPAETFHLFFYMKRHLVAVEYRSELMKTQAWRSSLHELLDAAALSAGFTSRLRLEPVPQQETILRTFRSFDRLTRLRVKLRIPNPELDRRTERLRQEMIENGIREYTQDMKNPAGLSVSEQGRPFATASMAQAGYKEGEVTMTGIRNGRRATVKTGNRATRGRIEGLRDFIRGMSGTLRTNEARNAIARIAEEVDKLVELPSPPPSE
jgi:hypothetical protein